LFLNLIIIPKTQSLGRLYIKESNIDFLPKLISEKKFINVVKNLTIFVEEYKKNGELKNVYINEKINFEKSKIIVSESGRIYKKDNKYILKLFDGGITNINNNNIFTLNFSETDYDLSNFSTKTVTYPKIQELGSIMLINCLKKIYLNKKIDKNQILRSNKKCEDRTLNAISEELYKRLILPLYTLIISLIGASLIVEPKTKYFMKFHKLNIFLVGSFIIILSQLSLKLFLISINIAYIVLLLPIILILFYYFIIFSITSYKFNLL
tara:strand:- start:1496 stop:2293 length:798 start_codon:yes stop_codon:yes gene_type:complete